MSRVSSAQYAFSSGEVSPLLYGRPDFQRFQTGLRRCAGFLPMRQGGFTRAPGTLFRGATDGNNAGRLIAFEFAVNDALQLEFTPFKMRVWRYGQLVDDSASPGTPYELATPYDAAAIARLAWVQSADVIYLVDGQLPMQKLSRLALDNWTIADHQIDDGPFMAANTNTARTITPSGETGAITIQAIAAMFTANMVGALIQMKPVSYPGIPIWTANEALSVGAQRRYDGNIYQLAAGSNSKSVPPQHTEGQEEVAAGVKWDFISDGVGVARITAFTNANTVDATVLKRIPSPCVANSTYRWALGAWSNENGHPKAIAIHDQRLVAAGTTAEPRTMWFSEIGNYAGFQPGVNAADSFAYAIDGSQSLNAIQWLAAGSRGLHAGALGDVFSSRSDTREQAIGPTTFMMKRDASLGVSPARPAVPDGKPIFISKDGQRVFELRYAFAEDRNAMVELSLPSDHLGNPGFVEMVWQNASQRLIWLRRGDGSLAVMLYDPDEEVLGWSTLSLAGGEVESICASPDPVTGLDSLLMIVKRTINGATVRHVEEQPLPFGMLRGSEPITDAVHLFSASKFAPNPATDTFQLPHMVGETVHAWTDQGEFGPLVVPPGGALVLDSPVNTAVIGLLDSTHEVETLDIRQAGADGDWGGRLKRILPGNGIRLHRTAALQASVVEREAGQSEYVHDNEYVLDLPVAAALTQGFSGVSELQLAGGYAVETSIRFQPVGGAPATVLALTAMIDGAAG